MPPELRKRKAPASEPATAPPAKKKGPVAKAVAKVKEVVTGSPKAKTNGTTSASKLAVGDTITLEGFGGEIETNDGVKTTLKALVDESKGGVVLFTYPKASTLAVCGSIFRKLSCNLLIRPQVQPKHACSATNTPILALRGSLSMGSLKIRPRPIPPSKRSKNYHTLSYVIPTQL